MPDGLIQYGKKNKIATITMDRPKKYNALIPTMIMELAEALERARQDHGVRAIVLRGAGGNFCAGDDLHPEERFKYGQPDLHTRLKTGYPRLVVDIMTLRKPVIAMVEGYAVGAGFDIALACDFRIVSSEARLASIYVKRGMGGGCAYLLPRFVGLGKATELLLLGDFIQIDEAIRLNLVTKVYSEDELETKAYEFAAKLAKGPTAAIGAIKNARNQGLACDPVKGIEHQILCNVELMFHKDAREGPRAFLEKREPNFTAEWIDLQYDAFVPYDVSKS
jgi:2-(1,2-epoxy-1,2-dihydrophenyl)acetyl-CoA isomerase